MNLFSDFIHAPSNEADKIQQGGLHCSPHGHGHLVPSSLLIDHDVSARVNNTISRLVWTWSKDMTTSRVVTLLMINLIALESQACDLDGYYTFNNTKYVIKITERFSPFLCDSNMVIDLHSEGTVSTFMIDYAIGSHWNCSWFNFFKAPITDHYYQLSQDGFVEAGAIHKAIFLVIGWK